MKMMGMFLKRKSKSHRSVFGFTLIEMMIAVAVMGLLTSVGVARYRKFNDRQEVLSAGREVISYLRDAQKRAKSGNRPDECESPYRVLDGYKVIVYNASSQVDIVAQCRGLDVVVKSVLLTNNTVFSGGGEYVFNVLSGGVDNAGIITVTDPTLTYSYQVEVTSTGAINDLGEM